ncbi:MAG: WYL domain-containing protein [Butyrivibrio sp.]|nr:WYL domain-containing protein [Butyrivibrio sp.]
MPKGTNQKFKLYYLAKIMVEKTDEGHFLTMPEIKAELDKYDVSADRKSLYEDLKALEKLGIVVDMVQEGRNYNYHVTSKAFELAELKLLVDSIQASKFITEKKSNGLIKKLTSFASEHETAQLKRQVVVQGRIKAMNESIFYVVDELHNAISNNRKIRFLYLQWDLNKEMVPRKEEKYEVSPWALTWNDENYYLIAFDESSGKIKHYRVDKMSKIDILEEKRAGKEHFEEFDMAAYTKMNFAMFGGATEIVRLRFMNELVGVIIDRFGKEIPIHKSSEEGWAETRVEVAVSDQFFGWIFGLGNGIKILGPDDVVSRYKKILKEVSALY